METPEDLDLEDDFDGEDGDGLGDYIRDLVSPWSDGLYGHENEDDKDGTIWAELQESGYNEEPLSAVVTTHLRAVLSDLVEKNADKMGGEVAEALRRWTEDANAEGLAEWLGKGGWDLVDADKVERRLNRAADGVFSKRVETTLAFDCENGMGGEWIKHVRAAFGLGSREDFSDLERDFPRWAEISKTLDGGKLLRGLMAEVWVRPKVWTICLLNVPRSAQTPERNAAWLESGGYEKPLEVLVGLDALRFVIQKRAWLFLEDFLQPQEKKFDWFRLLALAWMDERAGREAERLERQKHAVGIALRPKAETAAGKWTPLPRVLDVAAALGGPFSVDVDGETYAPEPGLAPDAVGRALRPRGLDIVPADWLGNPAQLTLALDPAAPPEAVREYMIETAARTAHLAQLPNMCPKLLGFMFAAAPMTGRPVKGTLLDLARWMYPEWSTGEGPIIKPWKDRRQNKRDLQGLGAAFVAVKGLRLVETKADGTRHPYDLFTVDYDLSCKPDAVLGFMVNPWLVERMKGGKGGGFFLLNMTRWLALGIQNPRLFPLALRLAALWDAARVRNGPFDPARLRPIEADRLAWECNTLPEGAAMYRAKRTDAHAGKVQLLRARDNLEADLDALREAGLLGPWKKTKAYGRGFDVLPMPPADYAEACKRAAQAVRKTGDGRRRKGPGKRKG